jgi:hypothetical protein
VQQENPDKLVSVRVGDEISRRLRIAALEEKTTLANLCTQLFCDYLEKRKDRESQVA